MSDHFKDKVGATEFLGILMLDTNFPRVIGDAGNIDSYSYKARTLVVDGAGSLDIVKDGLPTQALISLFCDAARQLEYDGAKAIVSTCGFLISVQNQIAESVNIPVMLSALSLYPKIKKQHGDYPIGIITASESSLGDLALRASGINSSDVKVDEVAVYIKGMEDCTAFTNAFLKPKGEQSLTLDTKNIENAVIEKANRLVQTEPEISAILLECGNLPPYAKAIKEATGLPVYSILDGADFMMFEQQS